MKRLTKEKAESYWRKGRHPTKYTSRHTFQEVADRLAAYEDTGLTPETVAQLKQIAEIFNCDPADPAQLKALCVKLQEMAQTERDGRLVVLPHPAKEGDQPPECFYGSKELCPGLTAITDDEPVENCKKCRWCSAGYFQLEAEAAVELMKGEGEHG